ncbi:ATP-binding cassette domain-containing protein [Anaeromyxobacter sp. SG17]|uniref:ATP-binding cassette domain-containing protein n=1 Tax=Anaeromyxobacter sp. SG17 TaxID=2925405 RepID=UPI001F577738|nr:ATP-binding cassette domain-containing protein [Anaeromyxobacter sp. SG17]
MRAAQSTEGAPAIELREVVKRYGAEGLGPVSLAVPAARTVALIGPSGAGKSTLLRLVLGLVAPDRGEVRLRGAPLRPEDHAARRRLGYVVQGGGLFPHLTAGGNAALVARHLRWPEARVAARLGELAALTRFPAEALARFPHELSGGQAQRVSLMRALFLEPEVLLLDEPLGALDPITRADLQADLREIFASLGKTVLLVTHDLAEAVFFAHELVLLRDGRVLQRGSLDALVRTPADPFVARFVHAQRALGLPAGTAP